MPFAGRMRSLCLWTAGTARCDRHGRQGREAERPTHARGPRRAARASDGRGARIGEAANMFTMDAEVRPGSRLRPRRWAGLLAVAALVASLAVPGPTAAGDPPATPSSLRTGAETACLLKHDGSIACWGAVPGALPEGPFLDVSTGGDLDSESVCAVLATGALSCWGWIGNAVPSGTYRAVSVDGSYACAIAADDTLRCWGNDDAEAWPVPPTGTFRAVSVRPDYYSCAIRRDDGSIACWGAESGNVPNLPSGSFTSISRDCAIRDDDRLVCWGSGLPMSPTGTYADVSVVSTTAAPSRRTVSPCAGAPTSRAQQPSRGLLPRHRRR